jgi:hypothetical protein
MKIREQQLVLGTVLLAIVIVFFNIYHIITNNVPENNYDFTTISPETNIINSTIDGILAILTNPLSAAGMVVIIIIFCVLYSIYKKPKKNRAKEIKKIKVAVEKPVIIKKQSMATKNSISRPSYKSRFR